MHNNSDHNYIYICDHIPFCHMFHIKKKKNTIFIVPHGFACLFGHQKTQPFGNLSPHTTTHCRTSCSVICSRSPSVYLTTGHLQLDDHHNQLALSLKKDNYGPKQKKHALPRPDTIKPVSGDLTDLPWQHQSTLERYGRIKAGRVVIWLLESGSCLRFHGQEKNVMVVERPSFAFLL